MKFRSLLKASFAFFATCWLGTALADGESEFLLFLSFDDLERASVDEPELQTSDATPTIDVLFSNSKGAWHVLGEHLLTDDESELERLQVGYDVAEDTTVWLGRFHPPISAWNYRYHQGAYLQPSITKPSIENWEDESGVIPAHVTGLMVDGWRQGGEKSGIHYVAAAGLGPTFADGELVPLDTLNPGDHDHGAVASVSVSYFPDYVGESNIGLIAGYTEIQGEPNPALGIDTVFEIRQRVLGAQLNWETTDWQLLAAMYSMNNDASGTDVDLGGALASGYAQFSRNFSKHTNGYLRIEATRNANNNGYLTLFPKFVYNRHLLGFRCDFAERQAFNLEFSDNRITSDNYFEVRAQWSAVFP